MKANLLRKRSRQGAAPGTLEAQTGALPSRIQVFAYDGAHMEETGEEAVGGRAESILARISSLRKKGSTLWINVSGLADVDIVAGLGKMFDLHPLALEDALNPPQRSKVDEYEHHIFLIASMIEEDDQAAPILDQLSLFWGEGFVISFQERPGDSFDPVRERLRKDVGRPRFIHPDYLAYALLDAVIDGYFPALEKYGDLIDEMEDDILERPTRNCMMDIHKTKRDLHILRLCLWPMRDSVSKLRAETGFVREETMVYLRDCQDHVIQVLDIIESYRERISALNDLYLSSVSNRLNEVMKVLTVVGTIFMPLSFIVGLYGMNFDTQYPLNMPELKNPYGYPAVLAFMLVVTIGMLFAFWRAGWINFRKKMNQPRN